MLAEPVPNKQFYSFRPGRQRPATAGARTRQQRVGAARR